MAVYIQIGDDPTKWWLVQPFNANQLTGQPLTLNVASPIGGWMVLNGRAASVAVFNEPDATVPADVTPAGGTIYLPTAAGASAHNYGYGLVINEALGGQNLGRRDRDRDAQRDPPDHSPLRRRDAGDQRRDAGLRRRQPRLRRRSSPHD